MTAIPASGYLSDNARTEGEQKSAFEALRDAIAEMPGNVAEQDLTLSGDAITPAARASRIINVDTEGGAGTDNLATITQTNTPDGSILIIRSKTGSRVPTVKNAAGGTGQILTGTGADFVLSSPKMTIMLQRQGTSWVELFRSYGDQTTAQKTALGLGTAASVNTGTGSSDVPTITAADGRYAKLGGSTSQAFNVADSPSTKNAVNKDHADATYAKKAGDVTQNFSAKDPTADDHVVTRGYANSNYSTPARFVSSDLTITPGDDGALAHGLPAAPKKLWYSLVCQTAGSGYSVGDEILFSAVPQAAISNQGISLCADATNVSYVMGAASAPFAIMNKTTGQNGLANNSAWKVRIYAEV